MAKALRLNEAYLRRPFSPVSERDWDAIIGRISKAPVRTTLGKESIVHDGLLILRGLKSNSVTTLNEALHEVSIDGTLATGRIGSRYIRMYARIRQVTDELRKRCKKHFPRGLDLIKSLPSDGRRTDVVLWWPVGVSEKADDFSTVIHADNKRNGHKKSTRAIVIAEALQLDGLSELAECCCFDAKYFPVPYTAEAHHQVYASAIAHKDSVLLISDTLFSINSLQPFLATLRLIRNEYSRHAMTIALCNSADDSVADTIPAHSLHWRPKDILATAHDLVNHLNGVNEVSDIVAPAKNASALESVVANVMDHIRDNRVKGTFSPQFVNAIAGIPLKMLNEGFSRKMFRWNMDSQHQFLTSAAPIYGAAAEVYATNTPGISTFWDAPAFEEMRAQYLPLCPTTRLCIFRDHQDFMDNARNLLIHMEHYAQGNHHHSVRYVVTSEQLWKEWCGANGNNSSDLPDSDFAYVKQKDGTWCRFKLSPHDVSLDFVTGPPSNDRLFTAFASSWSKVTHLAHYWEDSRASHTDGLKCFAFSKDFFSESNFAVQALQGVFGKIVPRTGVHHILVFRPDKRITSEKLQGIVKNVRESIAANHKYLHEKYGLTEISYGILMDQDHCKNWASHASAHGRIARTFIDGNEIVLIMRFRSEDHVESYYTNDDEILHGIFRSLYKGLIDAAQISQSDIQIKTFARIVETLGCDYYTRRDYSDKQSIDEWFNSEVRKLFSF